MKALTVQQPWAWAIVAGGKAIENRSTGWSYRGLLAIHAGCRISTRGQDSELVKNAKWTWAVEHGRVEPVLVMGAIIGIVDLVDAHPDANCCRPWGESAYTHGITGRPVPAVHHLVLENPRPMEPVPVRGQLGLWTVPECLVMPWPRPHHGRARADPPPDRPNRNPRS